jgi:uncharacterized protein (TIGR03437 family)
MASLLASCSPPGAVGPYQIDAGVAVNARIGNPTVVIVQNGSASNAATIPVR